MSFPEHAPPPGGPTEAAPESAAPSGPPPAFGAGIAPNQVTELVADLLGATGLLTPGRLAEIRVRAGNGSIAQALLDEGLGGGATDEPSTGSVHELADRFGLPVVDLAEVAIDPEAAASIPAHILERIVALPYTIEGNRLRVAVADPSNVQAIDELRLATRYALDLSLAPPDDIMHELRRVARAAEAWDRTALLEDELEVNEPDGENLDADDGISEAPLVRLVNSIILQAAEDGASDLHFLPQDDSLVVRLRVDGVLTEVQRIPKRLANGVTTRLKVLSKLDIAERRKPQDGRISLSAKAVGRRLDIRVAVLPTVEGEAVVMRLLDKSKRAPTLTELGLSDEMRLVLESIIRKPTGAVLVTGPTGSGKSTTLYAALSVINRPEVNIITVEDPVEYRLPGINQVQMHPRAGLTFASALRSILRSDPDVVMVGEIRDTETAKISIEAALTGHFVLSTLHTNDAPSAITRLNEMEVEPFLTSAAVSAILAQRLARKLCTHCAEMYAPSVDDLLEARFTPDQAAQADGLALYRKRGCPRCNQTGYKGRVGIFQLMVMNETLGRLATQRAAREDLERAAMDAGMETLWDDGLAKVAGGLTSVEELGRVLA